MAKTYSPSEIKLMREMASQGHDNNSIARALGRPPIGVNVKRLELGILLQPHKRAKPAAKVSETDAQL